jgi:hypothetical protein
MTSICLVWLEDGRSMKWFLSVPGIMLLATLPAFAQAFTNPVAYCKAEGTIDRPDSRYTGPKLPAWMARDLNLKPGQSKLMEWRCANGTVLACVYGANIPCDSKANTKPEADCGHRRLLPPERGFEVRAHGSHRSRDDGVMGLPRQQSGRDQFCSSRCPGLCQGLLEGGISLESDL